MYGRPVSAVAHGQNLVADSALEKILQYLCQLCIFHFPNWPRNGIRRRMERRELLMFFLIQQKRRGGFVRLIPTMSGPLQLGIAQFSVMDADSARCEVNLFHRVALLLINFRSSQSNGILQKMGR